MNRIARIRLGAVAFTLVAAVAALGQDNGAPELLSAGFANAQSEAGAKVVVAGTSIALGINVSGGATPYKVTISDDGPIDGGRLDATVLEGDGPTFEFVYTAPSDDVGTNVFSVVVEDAAGTTFALPIVLPVLCPGIGLCTEKLTNAELITMRLLDFNPEITEINDAGEVVVADPGTVGSKLSPPNLAPANLLNRLDVDEDGQPDNITDTDGDGLPDNWELGGAEENDRVVFFPAPSAIVPGTPPTPIFTRRAVATSALRADTDGDGLSDFVEVFGLKFIDEDGDGRLDPNEWADFNEDGMPSVGEYPLDNVQRDASGAAIPNAFGLLHDFDGFMFTDPTNPDTDGDGTNDGDDNDPLINPRSFGNTAAFFVRFDRSDDPDIDKDGIGNGMDMGNDLNSADGLGVVDFQGLDNPANMEELLDLFREDLLGAGEVPESVVEDLLGADWDGNGLWRTTDLLNRRPVVDPNRFAALHPPDLFFTLDSSQPDQNRFYFPQTLDGSTAEEIEAGKKGLVEVVTATNYEGYNGRGIGLAWQDLLRPPTTTNFIPDRKIWAILYAWRMPGFDIDGDGFVGGPLADDVKVLAPPPQIELDNIRILQSREQSVPQLDGVIEVPGLQDFFRGCGGLGLASLTLLVTGLGLVRLRRRR